MKHIRVLLILFCIASVSNAQIPVTTVKIITEEELKQAPFDGSKNFLGQEPYAYVGEDLYLPDKIERDRVTGWDGFIKDISKSDYKEDGNIFQPMIEKPHLTEYAVLANKLYKVVDVHKSPAETFIYFLQLHHDNLEQDIYFIYDVRKQVNFPFIAMKYYERLKKELVGQSYLFSNRYIAGKKDVKTGFPISCEKDNFWKCIDITLNGLDYKLSLLLSDQAGNTILAPVEYVIDNKRAFTKEDVELYSKKYEESWTKILDEELEAGYTPEMVRLAWGYPARVRGTADGFSWHYGNNNTTLLFKNGKLETSF